ncbi:MAG: hypothetical protein KGI98_12045 [Euryarchaeota archaeon]|nr:hypothetical protein [Euryarchaeota archaeon]MDE1881201.1 hypothetical protein [Euryarchaeota archaeon]
MTPSSYRIDIPTNEIIEELLRRHRDAMRLHFRNGTAELIETALRHSHAYGGPEAENFAYNGRRRAIHLGFEAAMAPPPRLLASRLQHELAGYDARRGSTRDPLATYGGKLEKVRLFLPAETLWKVRVSAFHQGIEAVSHLSEITTRVLREFAHIYKFSGTRYVEVPVLLQTGLFNPIADQVEKVGGHPEFAISHHIVERVELASRRA